MDGPHTWDVLSEGSREKWRRRFLEALDELCRAAREAYAADDFELRDLRTFAGRRAGD
jgi:hypothetical protein